MNFALRIEPKLFFKGLLLGVVVMFVMGRWAQQHDTYGDRIRFFQAVSPERGVFPTLSNLEAFVREKAPPEKILILVAGSSVCLGIGQPETHLWSTRLQEILGDDFVVVNTSFRGMRFNQIGVPLARHLRREYSRMILVSDVSPVSSDPVSLREEPPNTAPYNYFAWQEIAHRILRGQEEAAQEAWGEWSAGSSAQKTYIEEKLMAGCWEAITGASSFWNWVGYRVLFTANIFTYPVRPLVLKRDDEDQNLLPAPERFIKNRSHELQRLEAQVAAGKNAQQDPGQQKHAIETLVRIFSDDSLVRNTIFLINGGAPYFVEALSPEDRAFYRDLAQKSAEGLKQAGFGSTILGLGYAESDYVDWIHPSWEGGLKMAKSVAGEVMRISRKENFLP